MNEKGYMMTWEGVGKVKQALKIIKWIRDTILMCVFTLTRGRLDRKMTVVIRIIPDPPKEGQDG